MSRTATIAALATVALAASSANAAIIVYQFSGPLISNSMASGAFDTSPIGAAVTLQITVETSTVPSLTSSTRRHWDGVAGTILAMQATVNGVTSIATVNSAPTYARVCDDAANGGSFVDQFWFQVSNTIAAPDFVYGSAILSTIGAAPPVSSSLSGVDFPTDPSNVVASSFLNEHYILLRGQTGPEFLRADITSITVVPAPGVGAMCAITGLAAIRRRR